MTALRWLFENRQTGRITVAQWPNAPLWVWIVAATGHRLTDGADRILDALATSGLLVWAALEVWEGVNPWRRLLGAGALLSVVGSLLSAG